LAQVKAQSLKLVCQMSYWYARFAKKHIFIALSIIPVALASGYMIQVGSYGGGCTPTLSRTLDDWLFVETSMSGKELIPFVYMALEPGCITWMGFSTCEHVQFEEWKLLLNSPRKASIFAFNVTNSDAIKTGTKPSLLELDPIRLEERYADTGSTVADGIFKLRRTRHVTMTYSEWSQHVITPNIAHIASLSNSASSKSSLFASVQIGSLMGLPGFETPSSGMKFYTQHESEKWDLQSSVRFGVKGLMYF